MNFEMLFLFGCFATVIVAFKNYLNFKKNLELFYTALDDMIENYYIVYPRTPDDYFQEMVLPEYYTQWRFWISDFNLFVLDTDKLKELYHGDKKYKDIKEGNEMYCPWCGIIGSDHFQFYPLDPDKVDDTGILVCLECKATSPPGNVDGGTFVFDNKNVMVY